ncbi:twin-arginine translocation signal domain-containing protein [Streptomyces megasporus]|uniref:twin-arginine translocation signal domain-containing protein n=1 Tax=Streptomyces megasporus TaxID=44060 RepID=UPI0004E0FFD0|nr:twin-arginine translocation signal domain-containing protein [Streptomyces megasporus]
MSPRPTRRGFLNLAGRTAVAAGATALPTPAHGTAPTTPHTPAPVPPRPPDDVCDEPPDAGVRCDLDRADT